MDRLVKKLNLSEDYFGSERVRETIKKGPANNLDSNKPFAIGMYHFTMFIISYYSRVREKLKIDYDSFMIIQTAVSHSLYQLNKKKLGPKVIQN